MTTVESAGLRTQSRTGVALAGTTWPMFKLEALAAALVVLVVAFAITQSAQVAVLGAAAVATVIWVGGTVRRHRPAR